MASLWYCAIGHGRDEMADAIARQIRTLETYSCFDPFTTPAADQLAERLVDLTPIPDARVFLCQSGSEAVDSAMKLARVAHVQSGHPERTLIISRMRGYHGTNYGGTSAQGLPVNKRGWGQLLPEVVQVPSDDIEALAKLMAERSDELAAVITEPVQGAAGVWPPEEGYLESVRRLCDQHGAYLVFDEVITGFGRLGEWFAADHYGVVPDITTFAKAVTSGYQPLGGVFVNGSIRAALEADPAFKLTTGYTYSGHATACVAALTNIAIIEREGLLDRAADIGHRLGAGIRSLADDGVFAGVRGDGAMWAAAMHPDQDADADPGSHARPWCDRETDRRSFDHVVPAARDHRQSDRHHHRRPGRVGNGVTEWDDSTASTSLRTSAGRSTKNACIDAQRKLLALRLDLGGHLDDPDLGPGVLVVMEGSDAGGKGGAIKRIVEPLDPRHYRVSAFAKPTFDEKRKHFLWRFWTEVPGLGGFALFDRSWYGRVLVERVEGYATQRAVEARLRRDRAVRTQPRARGRDHRQVLAPDQPRRATQAVREPRRDDPLRRWKLTDEDWRNRDKIDLYNDAVEDMFDQHRPRAGAVARRVGRAEALGTRRRSSRR